MGVSLGVRGCPALETICKNWQRAWWLVLGFCWVNQVCGDWKRLEKIWKKFGGYVEIGKDLEKLWEIGKKLLGGMWRLEKNFGNGKKF